VPQLRVAERLDQPASVLLTVWAQTHAPGLELAGRPRGARQRRVADTTHRRPRIVHVPVLVQQPALYALELESAGMRHPQRGDIADSRPPMHDLLAAVGEGVLDG